MKQKTLKITGVLVAVCISVPAVLAAVPSGWLRRDEVAISDNALLSNGIYTDNAQKKQVENIIEYKPSEDLRPKVAYGNTLYGRSTLDYVADFVSNQDLTVTAGINGSFFHMGTGVPYGIVVSDGFLRTSGNINSVGFDGQGNAVIGRPGLTLDITFPNGNAAASHYNKVISRANGLVLYSGDYDLKTKNKISTYNVVIKPEKTQITTNTHMTAKVVSIHPDTASVDIPSGHMVLSMATDTTYLSSFQSRLGTLKIGDTVQIETSIDSGWKDVTQAVSGDEMLVENGVAVTDFAHESADLNASRTAVGIKKDGTVVFYTGDGRQSTYAAGLTLPQLAQRMVELGCVTALNLDGGGSTTISAQYPGDSALSGVNQPSDGKQRKCANFIFLVREEMPKGAAANLHLYPYDALMLNGATLQLDTKATDEHYQAVTAPKDINYTATGGSVTATGAFTANGAGEATISASSGGATGEGVYRVVETPTVIYIQNEQTNSVIKSLSAVAGQTVNLAVDARYLDYKLVEQDENFTWSVTGDIGTIDEKGVFTAVESPKEKKGEVICTAGERTTKIPVTVSPSKPEGEAIYGFETGEVTGKQGMKVTVNSNNAYTKYAQHSAKLQYKLSSTSEGISGQSLAQFSVKIPTGRDTIGVWVYGDNSLNSVSFAFTDGTNKENKWVSRLNFAGWKLLQVEIPAGMTELSGVAITQEDEAPSEGIIYIDQVISSNGMLMDTTPPALTAKAVKQTIEITATDKTSGIKEVIVSINGKKQTMQTTQGKLTVLLDNDGKAKQVQVTAVDNVGNLTSQTLSVAGTLVNPFSDMGTHWSKTYVNFCHGQGILNGSTDENGNSYFRPDDPMTRQEFAVALVRFLDIDVENYGDTTMPFADADAIAPWAEDAMKATYALGYIGGASNNGKLYANPKNTITRQETMAILGRTQMMGYGQNNLSGFSDGASIASWAKEATAIMVERGVIAGADGKISPTGNVTRGQVAKMLYQLY